MWVFEEMHPFTIITSSKCSKWSWQSTREEVIPILCKVQDKKIIFYWIFPKRHPINPCCKSTKVVDWLVGKATLNFIGACGKLLIWSRELYILQPSKSLDMICEGKIIINSLSINTDGSRDLTELKGWSMEGKTGPWMHPNVWSSFSVFAAEQMNFSDESQSCSLTRNWQSKLAWASSCWRKLIKFVLRALWFVHSDTSIRANTAVQSGPGIFHAKKTWKVAYLRHCIL